MKHEDGVLLSATCYSSSSQVVGKPLSLQCKCSTLRIGIAVNASERASSFLPSTVGGGAGGGGGGGGGVGGGGVGVGGGAQ